MHEEQIQAHQEGKSEQRDITTRHCYRWINIETQGINPVPPDQRPHTRIWDNFTIWFSVSSAVVYLMIGMVGWQLYELAFWQAFLCIVLGNAIASIPGSFYSTLGFRTGLRQMVLVRYSFGYYGGKVVSALNWINSVGWMIINIIQSAQFFDAMGPSGQPSRLPLWAGVVVLAAATWIICLIGYKLIHNLQRWLWIPMWTAFGLLFGLGLTRYESNSSVLSYPAAEPRAVMSFFGLVYSSTPLWPFAAADFTVRQPTTFNPSAVGILSYLGGILPTILLETLAFVLAAVWIPEHPDKSGNAGALAADIFAPIGWFGQLVLVVFAVNAVVHVVPSAYSMALTVQTILPWRRIWVLATFNMIIVAILGAFGSEDLVRILQIFLPPITYCIAGYNAILLSEHFVFRSRRRYNIESWNDPRQLPVGAAAILSLVIAFGAGMLATSQPWFIGPIAKRVGDLGVPLSLAFGFCFYNPLRYWEKKIFHR